MKKRSFLHKLSDLIEKITAIILTISMIICDFLFLFKFIEKLCDFNLRGIIGYFILSLFSCTYTMFLLLLCSYTFKKK